MLLIDDYVVNLFLYVWHYGFLGWVAVLEEQNGRKICQIFGFYIYLATIW